MKRSRFLKRRAILKISITVFFYFIFLSLLFGCPTANFEPLSRRQSHSPDVTHLRFTYSTQRSPGTSYWGWVPKPGRAFFKEPMLFLLAYKIKFLRKCAFSQKCVKTESNSDFAIKCAEKSNCLFSVFLMNLFFQTSLLASMWHGTYRT